MLRKLLVLLFCFATYMVSGQDLHFSQSFNQPLLYNPAQTALIPDADYRALAHYRTQWGNLPVPYKTVAATADLKAFAHQHKKSWLGLGIGFYNDLAGDGDLSLLKSQFNAAYHLEISESSIISLGIGLAAVQRKVNMSKLTFDNQWNGIKFDQYLSSRENNSYEKTSYLDASIGLSYAFMPSEALFFQVAAGVMHVNQPNESFYSTNNQVRMRPVLEVRNVILLSDDWIAEWSIHGSTQQNAYELVGGGQVSTNLTPRDFDANVLLAGVYYRWQESLIPMIGYEWNKIRLLMSFDIPFSRLGPSLRGYGGMELSLVFKGLYEGGRTRNAGRKSYGCPRF